MYTSAYVNLLSWFYPIGNTPAVNLLRTLPVLNDAEPGEVFEIFCLACGDPRSILFSLYCSESQDGQSRYNFTCCDYDPAILARNIVLFTLITNPKTAELTQKEDQTSDIWNLFYHFFVPQRSLSLLREQVELLLDTSRSFEAWMESHFSKFIGFVDKDSLVHIRKYWDLYSQSFQYSGLEAKGFEQRIRKSIAKSRKSADKGRYTLSGIRSVGICTPAVIEVLSHAFDQYWETGVVGGNSEDVCALRNFGKGHVNPMFAFSSAPTGDFRVHYGSDPLLGYRLTDAFNLELDGKSSTRIEAAVSSAKTQFANWTDTFRRYVQNDRLFIRLCCGEATRICHKFQNQNNESYGKGSCLDLYASQWHCKPLSLDGYVAQSSATRETKPTLFHVIDTSNLSDYIGILNVLAAAKPLLLSDSISILHTGLLLPASEDTLSTLPNILHSNPVTLSLAIGLAPVDFLLGFSTDTSAEEMIRLYASGQVPSQLFLRIAWKFIAMADPLIGKTLQVPSTHFDPTELARYLFSIYKQIFKYEDMMSLMAIFKRQLTSPLSTDYRHYTRPGIAAIFSLIQSQVCTDWHMTMEIFLDLLYEDPRAGVGSNNIQELLLHLHQMDLWSAEASTQDPRSLDTSVLGGLRSVATETRLLAQESLPPVVYVLLQVPRKKLDVFTNKKIEEVGTPGLHISISQNHPTLMTENHFYGIQCFFGKVAHFDHESFTCDVLEDESGWQGSADLLVTCQVPTYSLLIGPRQGVRAGLAVNTSPISLQYVQDLGPQMMIFETGLQDERRLFILRRAPNFCEPRPQEHPSTTPSSPLQLLRASSEAMHVKLSSEYDVKSLLLHVDLSGDLERSAALAKGSIAQVSQYSPCSLSFKIGETAEYYLNYQFPIDSSSPNIRLARKSCWFEVSVSVSGALDKGGFESNPFPVLTHTYRPPLSWSLPRINLDRQPKIILTHDSFTQGLVILLKTSFSASEHGSSDSISSNTSSARLDLKRSIHVIFLNFLGHGHLSRQFTEFLLCNDQERVRRAVLLVSSIRLDFDSGSPVLDGYIVPLNGERVSQYATALQKLEAGNTLRVTVSDEEWVLWKKFVPAITERCREWNHQKECKAFKHTRLDDCVNNGSLVCACAQGCVPADFPREGLWSEFSYHATRIALSPLYLVPYLESSSTKTLQLQLGNSGIVDSSPQDDQQKCTIL
ncbi:MAG: hypothetical protein M1814_005102 [Vezdaea aestivalis]|nr:MAG: hypothetical protein M1814_005102 [Vezdaea aestivalis]